MKNLLLLLCIIGLVCSCSKDDPYIADWMSSSIGIDNSGEIGKAYIGNDTLYTITGLKDNKLCIGIFRDLEYSRPLFVWTAKDNFQTDYEVDEGYGVQKKIKLDPYTCTLDITDQSNFKGVVVSGGRYGEDTFFDKTFSHILFVNNDTYKLYDPIETIADYSPFFYNWYDNSLIYEGIIYTYSGETIPNLVFPAYYFANTYPINMYEGIKIEIYDISKININSGEIWTNKINEDIIMGINPPIIKSLNIEKNNMEWTINMNIVFYNGEQENRRFLVNIDTGEITQIDSQKNI